MSAILPQSSFLGVWLSAALLLGAEPALAGEALSFLTPRGQVQSTDQLPILPANAPRLESTTAGAILGYVRNYPPGIVCDGSHDDTAAIQAALNSGSSFDLPPGTCLTSAALTISTAASHGQTVRGAGETASDGAGSGKTTIRPAASVTTAVLIDGSPFGGYIQGFSIEGFSLDMGKMAPGARGFSQLQAYDIHYSKIRVMNDAGKTSWNFGPGAYTTSLDDVQGALVYCLGNGMNNPTTITLLNPDIGGLNVEQCVNVTTLGGAIQPLYTTTNMVWLPTGTSPEGFGPNPDGMYLAVSSYLLNAQFISTIGTDWEALSQPSQTCVVSGWTFGTYDDGTHGCHPIVMGVEVGSGVANVSLLDATFAGMYLYDLGAVGENLTLTGYQTGGGEGNYHKGIETFDANVFLNNSKALFGYNGDRATGGANTILLDASSGSANFSGNLAIASLYAGESVNGQQLFINPTVAGSNFANIGPFGCFNSTTVAGSSCFMGSGSKFVGLQDAAGTTQSFALDAATGRITSGSGMCPGAGTDASPTETGAACIVSGNGNPPPNVGMTGWFYLRGDCTHGTSNCLWHKENGVWVDIF